MNALTKPKSMTTKELAKKLGTSPKVLLTNAKKCLPNKKIENGKPTFWNEKEVTVLLETLKHNNHNQSSFTGAVKVIETSLSNALKIEMLHKQIELILQDENEKLKHRAEVAENRVAQLEYNATERVYGAKDVARIISERSGEPFSFRKVKPIAVELGIYDNADYGRTVDFDSGHHNGRTWQYNTKALELIWDKVCED